MSPLILGDVTMGTQAVERMQTEGVLLHNESMCVC